jgi:glycerol uptake facilitator-like aquaporin
MFYHQIPKILSISVKVRSGGNYVAEILGTFILLIAILLLIHYQSDKLALIIGLIVGGELITTSSTMFANPQVTLARTLTYSQAGIRPMDAAIFIIMQLVGMLLAVGTWKFLEKSQLPKS